MSRRDIELLRYYPMLQSTKSNWCICDLSAEYTCLNSTMWYTFFSFTRDQGHEFHRHVGNFIWSPTHEDLVAYIKDCSVKKSTDRTEGNKLLRKKKKKAHIPGVAQRDFLMINIA